MHGVSGIPVFQWEGPSGVTLPSPSSITRLTNIEQNVSTHLIFNDIEISEGGQYYCNVTLDDYSNHDYHYIHFQSKFDRSLSDKI